MAELTIAEARTHFKFPDTVADAAVRAQAEADDIEIKDEEPDTDERLRALQTAVEALKAADDEESRATLDTIKKGITALQGDPDGLSTPSKTEGRTPVVRVYDRFDMLGYGNDPNGSRPGNDQYAANKRSNLEMAAMIFGGTREIASVPTVEMPADFRAAWQHHVFGDPETAPQVVNGDGYPIRAMDTAESGFGLELIGAQYVTQLWEAARNNDSLVGSIREIPMTDPTTTVPVDGDLPEMLFVGESTSSSASAYTTSKTGSGSTVLTAKKFTIQQIWSSELTEDSIIQFVPFLRDKLNMSAGLYLGSSYYNGDTETGGTGNINKDDGAPGSEKHYLAYNGIRRFWLVDNTGQGKNMAAELDPKELTRSRGKLNGGDDDVDALLKNINWGTNVANLRAIMDWDTYMAMLDLDIVRTIDQYGPQATVFSGELGRLPGGIPIITPSYASKTQADGKASDTEGSNTLGQISIVALPGWLAGRRRDVQLFFDRIQRTDQFLFELYTRRAFSNFGGGNEASGIYNIVVA